MRRARDWFANPWGRPRALGTITWLYMVWSVAPVVLAILFSFNDGRSRSVWQGFPLRWYYGDPSLSVLPDPSMRGALEQSLRLAGLDMLIAVPLGVGLALGLTRWRGYGARPVNWKGWASAFAVIVVLLGVVRFMVVTIPGGAAHPAWEVILGLAIALGLVAGFSRFARHDFDDPVNLYYEVRP